MPRIKMKYKSLVSPYSGFFLELVWPIVLTWNYQLLPQFQDIERFRNIRGQTLYAIDPYSYCGEFERTKRSSVFGVKNHQNVKVSRKKWISQNEEQESVRQSDRCHMKS